MSRAVDPSFGPRLMANDTALMPARMKSIFTKASVVHLPDRRKNITAGIIPRNTESLLVSDIMGKYSLCSSSLLIISETFELQPLMSEFGYIPHNIHFSDQL